MKDLHSGNCYPSRERGRGPRVFPMVGGKPRICREGRPRVLVRETSYKLHPYTWTLPAAGGRLDAVCSESGSERTVVRGEHRVPGRWRWVRRGRKKPSSSQNGAERWRLTAPHRVKLPYGRGESSAGWVVFAQEPWREICC
uniref:Uncharacterized protein n=1 Tax=Myotis myotis TaxID=51298 RepID=A0A7J7UCY0_MYOMY|nr:hypothetical protein mMyoMyo1_008775 [Myotis myotis]